MKAASQALGCGSLEPEYVMGDGNTAISTAANIVFPYARLFCWYHVKKAMKSAEAWKEIPNRKLEKRRVLAEISDLQLTPTEAIFRQAAAILLAKWNQRGLGKFSGYFAKEWMDSNSFWYVK